MAGVGEVLLLELSINAELRGSLSIAPVLVEESGFRAQGENNVLGLQRYDTTLRSGVNNSQSMDQ
jgi:hypothetical protein